MAGTALEQGLFRNNGGEWRSKAGWILKSFDWIFSKTQIDSRKTYQVARRIFIFNQYLYFLQKR